MNSTIPTGYPRTAATTGVGGQPWLVRLLLCAGVAGPLLFLVVLLIEGATRPGYNAWRHPISLLSLGEGGWMQVANFITCGVLVVAFAAGLRRVLEPGRGSTWGPIMVGVFGLGLIGSGIFTTNPMDGYPAGAVSTDSLHGSLHPIFGAVSSLSLAAATFVLARRFRSDPDWRGWALYSIVTGILFVVVPIATNFVSSVGLVQRFAIVLGWGWLVLLAYRLWTRLPNAGRRQDDAAD